MHLFTLRLAYLHLPCDLSLGIMHRCASAYIFPEFQSSTSTSSLVRKFSDAADVIFIITERYELQLISRSLVRRSVMLNKIFIAARTARRLARPLWREFNERGDF